jgi:hypothetical protein
MQHTFDILKEVHLIYWIIIVGICVAVNIIIFYSFARWFFRRQWRIYQNLRRRIIIIQPTDSEGQGMPGSDMRKEIQLLRESRLFNVISEPIDYHSFNPSGKHCIVVIGYKQGMAGIDNILNKIRTNHVPLIVYTYGPLSVPASDKRKFDEYPYTLFANFPITLLNHIFSTVASFPYTNQ